MPPDIRNFFGGKGAVAAPKKEKVSRFPCCYNLSLSMVEARLALPAKLQLYLARSLYKRSDLISLTPSTGRGS